MRKALPLAVICTLLCAPSPEETSDRWSTRPRAISPRRCGPRTAGAGAIIYINEGNAAMLNFDMIASPNFVRFVYDGDLSDSEPPEGGAPSGSATSRWYAGFTGAVAIAAVVSVVETVNTSTGATLASVAFGGFIVWMLASSLVMLRRPLML